MWVDVVDHSAKKWSVTRLWVQVVDLMGLKLLISNDAREKYYKANEKTILIRCVAFGYLKVFEHKWTVLARWHSKRGNDIRTWPIATENRTYDWCDARDWNRKWFSDIANSDRTEHGSVARMWVAWKCVAISSQPIDSVEPCRGVSFRMPRVSINKRLSIRAWRSYDERRWKPCEKKKEKKTYLKFLHLFLQLVNW